MLRADPLELELISAAVKHAHDYALERDRALARMIIGELGEALKRGKR